MYGEVVEVRLEVFQVEGEVEVVCVYEGGGFCLFLVDAREDETGKGRRTEREHLRRLFTMMSSNCCVTRVAMMSRP